MENRIVNVEPLIQQLQNDIEHKEKLLKEFDDLTDKNICQREISHDKAWLERLKALRVVDSDAAIPSAKWVEAPDEGADGSWDACSFCGYEARWARADFKFCPRCGSRMIGVE